MNYFGTLQTLSVPYFNRVIPQAGNDSTVIVLQAIDALWVFRSAVDTLKRVSAAPPVVFYLLNVFEDAWVELAVEWMVRLLFSWTRFEQICTPASALTQATPQGVGAHFPLNQFFPEHAIGNDSAPLFAH